MPVTFGTARNETVWQPEPGMRGTYSLLSSCILTMILCLWTTIHPNIPELEIDKSKIPYIPRWEALRKTLWLAIGLFAPEIITWIAFEQYREAKEVYARVRNELEEESEGEEQRLAFTDTIKSWFRSDRKRITQEGEGPNSESIPNLSAAATSLDTRLCWMPGGYGSVPVNTIPQPNPNVPRARRHNKWTMTHSYYAAMGGFVFDAEVVGQENEASSMLPHGRRRVTLTGDGVVELAYSAPHLLPDLTVAHIRDKSKANELGKTIVALQASWFAAQCISRMALGMTTSLLELTTLAHTLCALLAYALWWSKPLDVMEPSVIEGPDADLICAGMCMRTPMGTEFPRHGFNMIGARRKNVFARVSHEEMGSVSGIGSGGTSCFVLGARAQPESGSVPTYLPAHVPLDEQTEEGAEEEGGLGNVQRATLPYMDDVEKRQQFRLYMGQSLFGFAYPREALSRAARAARTMGPTHIQRPFVELSAGDLVRFRLAQRCFEKYPQLARVVHTWGAAIPPSEDKWGYLEWVTDRVGDWPWNKTDYAADEMFGSFFPGLLFAGVAYGGLHLLAWDPPVRTQAEVLIWRISAIAAIAGGAAPQLATMAYLGVHWCVSETYSHVPPRWKALWSQRDDLLEGQYGLILRLIDSVAILVTILGVIVLFVIIVACGAGALLYVVARVYLVVECFISIPRLPAAVFEVPVWSQYVPHIG